MRCIRGLNAQVGPWQFVRTCEDSHILSPGLGDTVDKRSSFGGCGLR